MGYFKKMALFGWGWLAFEVFLSALGAESFYSRVLEWMGFVCVLLVFISLAAHKGSNAS